MRWKRIWLRRSSASACWRSSSAAARAANTRITSRATRASGMATVSNTAK
jgi:hypothetical protein